MGEPNDALVGPGFGLKKFSDDGLLHEDGYALTLGCAMGDSIFLAQLGYVVDAVGNKMAREDVKQGGLLINFYFGDVSAFDVSPDTYDVIVANDALPMIEDKGVVARVMKKMVDGLASGGLFYFMLLTQQNALEEGRPRSFFGWEEALQLVAGLPLRMHYSVSEEGRSPALAGGSKEYSVYHFLYVKE